MDFHSVLISGNHIVIEWNFVGTHDGPMASPKGDIPPTGKAVNLKGVMIFRVAQEGLVEEDRTYFDTADLMAQLGLSD